jgi:hypothetical protein
MCTQRFLLDDQTFELDVRDGARVGSVCGRIASLRGCDVDAVSLLWLGKTLQNTMIVSALRIPPGRHMMVHTWWKRSICLWSCKGLGRPAPAEDIRPDDHDEQLVKRTGKLKRDCPRAFNFFDSDFSKALQRLLDDGKNSCC